ncbi:MAG: SixA phosphatase family protein [Frankiaceae bacterium]
MIATTRRLLLLRHAKSDWSDPGLADIDRPLAPRGRRGAAVVGAFLRERSLVPDLVVTSPSARTRETIELLDLGPLSVEADGDVYGAGEQELLERLQAVPGGIRTLMLVGHNPGIGRLAAQLVDDANRDLVGSYPTGALTVAEPEADTWAELTWHTCHVIAYVTPKSLARENPD